MARNGHRDFFINSGQGYVTRPVMNRLLRMEVHTDWLFCRKRKEDLFVGNIHITGTNEEIEVNEFLP
jgi:hypothetical protein